MVIEEKRHVKLFKYVIFRHTNSSKIILEQNNASKQKVGHCDKTMLQIFFIFTILKTYVSLIFHAKFSQNYPVGLEKKLILLFLLLLVMADILDS